MPPFIKPDQLSPGDVFLYHGDSFISKLIRLFDGTEYSHASIWQGDHVVEALGNGITKNTLAASVSGAKFVDVYRFISSEGQNKLGSAEYPAKPVLDRVAFYEAHPERYAYEEIVLLAMLASTRRLPIPGLGLVLRNVLDSASEVLARMVAAGKQPMICSELVYRCYVEAGQKYFIRIRGADVAMAQAASVLANAGSSAPLDAASAADAAFDEEAAVFLENFYAVSGATPPGAAVQGEASLQAVADFVTPGDLKKSPNLQLAGTLRL